MTAPIPREVQAAQAEQGKIVTLEADQWNQLQDFICDLYIFAGSLVLLGDLLQNASSTSKADLPTVGLMVEHYSEQITDKIGMVQEVLS